MRISIPRGSEAEVAFAWDYNTGETRRLGHGRESYSNATEHEICGTADMIYVSNFAKAGIIRDYKTGHGYVIGARGNAQILFLSMVAGKLYSLDTVIGEIVAVRDDLNEPRYDRAEFSRSDLGFFERDLLLMVRRLLNFPSRPAEYREGTHCRYCPSFDFCPAKKELLTFLAGGEYDPATAYVKTREIETMAKRALTRLKEVSDRELIHLGGNRYYGKSPAGKYEEHSREPA